MSAGDRKRTKWSVPLLAVLLLAGATDFSAAAQTAHWVQFNDPHTGLSFRHPPSLHVRLRDPQKFGLPNVATIVDLTGNTKLNRGTVVLRFLVKKGIALAGERAARREFLGRACTKTSPMAVDGHDAVVCVSRASAAIHWSVEILEPRECTIISLLGGADAGQAAPPPHDGEFPLLSIIRTVHFSVPSDAVAH